jgi:hypothetical protein
MQVHAVAGPVLIGFGHETGGKAVPPRQPLDQHLEQPGVVGHLQHVVGMQQVDLELADPGLGYGGVGVDVHRLAGVIEIGEETVERIQRAQRQRVGPGPALARPGAGRDAQVGTESSIR